MTNERIVELRRMAAENVAENAKWGSVLMNQSNITMYAHAIPELLDEIETLKAELDHVKMDGEWQRHNTRRLYRDDA